MTPGSNTKLRPQLIFGLCAVGFGVLLLLDTLELAPVGNVWRYWPMILIIIGIAQILWAWHTGSMVVGIAFAGFGAVMLLANLGFLRFYPWDLWPLILVAIGLGLVWQSIRRVRTPSSPAAEEVNGFALMSGVVRNCDSQSFRGGDLTAIMGGCEIDLREASIADGEATIQVLAIWGGVEIKVPEDWSVRSTVIPLLGGFEDKTRPPQLGGGKTLVLTGFAIMGGVEVRN